MKPMEEKPRSCLSKIVGSIIVLAILAGLVYGFYWYFSRSRCTIPVKFSADSVDSRFSLNKSQFTDTAKNAANEWNKQAKLDLFVYDPSANLKINMIYDSRQAEIDKIQGQVNTLQGQKTNLDSQSQQFDSLLAQYKDRLSKYNSSVEYYNSIGGAPPEQFNALNQEQKSLQNLRDTLNGLANTLNRQSDLYNANVDTLHQDINQSANKIITQGEFDPNGDTVSIYTYGGQDELKFVLMHELGHALGLDHVADPKALMYAMVQSQDIKNPKLTQADLDEMERVCNFQHRFTMPSLQDLRNLIFGADKQT